MKAMGFCRQRESSDSVNASAMTHTPRHIARISSRAQLVLLPDQLVRDLVMCEHHQPRDFLRVASIGSMVHVDDPFAADATRTRMDLIEPILDAGVEGDDPLVHVERDRSHDALSIRCRSSWARA